MIALCLSTAQLLRLCLMKISITYFGFSERFWTASWASSFCRFRRDGSCSGVCTRIPRCSDASTHPRTTPFERPSGSKQAVRTSSPLTEFGGAAEPSQKLKLSGSPNRPQTTAGPRFWMKRCRSRRTRGRRTWSQKSSAQQMRSSTCASALRA
ncbi:Hypothetical_protein [Hexamita inflata]|uniref:Hypothetical_protein n=1 Tax=Hexamita inflata TaxID=28002 RepID=A0ABP1KKD0_9EUKA